MNEKVSNSFEIHHLSETTIDNILEKELVALLEECFPHIFDGRTYFKQIPHSRLLCYENGILIGQLGLDFRIIRVGDTLLRALGVIDLCISPHFRSQMRGTAMLKRVALIAEQARADFQILFADDSSLYIKNGYKPVEPAMVTWLAIEERKTYGIIEKDMSGILLARPTKNLSFPPGKIDLLGYLF
ncbi:MAG: GNAT family N-acetyltransferase [Bacilli bacterium]